MATVVGYNGVLAATLLGALQPGRIPEDTPEELFVALPETEITKIKSPTCAIAVKIPAGAIVKVNNRRTETKLPYIWGQNRP